MVSVDDYSRTTGYEAAYERYQQLQCYKGMKTNVAILLKQLRSILALCIISTGPGLARYERYQQLQCYKGMKTNVAILLKQLCAFERYVTTWTR